MIPVGLGPPASGANSALSRHVPGLDGLRAIDVAVVLMFHGQVTTAGGFLGVSQFFTLSGFLVMSILLRSTASPDGVRLTQFWGRRYRRLMPASLLTLAGVVVFGFTLATEQQVDALRTSIPAALAQVVNWTFVVNETSYVDLFQSPSPIQHFWSLAIEEQFYLFIPILILGLTRLTRSPRVFGFVFAGLTVASATWAFVLFEGGASIDRIYYGTDTRAGEMLIGCVLAVVLLHSRPELSERGRRMLGAAGAVAMALIGWAFCTVSVTDAALYRGGFFAFSLLSCVVIYSLVEGVGPLARVLGLGPLAALGRISYGIYLFHWPLMLVLTEDRVGLDGWWLFFVQAGATTAMAAVSSRFVESPIRYGRAEPRDLRLPVAMLAVIGVIAIGAVSLAARDVETDLAGLGEDAGPAPVVDMGPLVVAVIADEPGLEFAATLTTDVAATLPFRADWDAAWADLVESTDPDVVLLHVSSWDQPGVSDDPDSVLAALRSGFALLTEKGATVVWGTGPVDFATAQRAENDPFHNAMGELSRVSSNVRRLGVADNPEKVAGDLELYRRRSLDDLPRLLILGDSVSRTAGYGLERWGSATGEALVWSAGTEGCGVASGGLVSDPSGREVMPPTACDSVTQAWADQIRSFDPDVVLVISAVADFRERRLPGWPAMLEPGDSLFDAYLLDEYIDAFDTLSVGGAQIVWTNPPCTLDVFGRFDEADGGSAVDLERILHVNDVILPQLIAARPEVATFDLYGILCPDDSMLIEVEGVGLLRPDGAHFTPESSFWLAENHGTEILGLD